MKIERQGNKIIITHQHDFDIEQILECGQVFSHYKTSATSYVVISHEKCATITYSPEKTVIESDDIDFFYTYFDLDSDYEKIKSEILNRQKDFSKFFVLGDSIRILRQEPVQIILSFIFSANNNIKRIRNFLTKVSQKFGTLLPCGFYSFPSLSQLSSATVKDFSELKAGYRSSYLVDTIRRLQTPEFSAKSLSALGTEELKKRLMTLQGVGPKVADCILLFGFARFDVFPVDTWIRKSFALFSEEKRTDSQIAEYFKNIFGEFSGYAQQYLYNFMLYGGKG